MKNFKTALLGLISLLFSSLPAQAENWVEVTAVGRDQSFYDSDSAFVDFYTGLAVLEIATWLPEDQDFTYLLIGIDCGRWQHYTIGLLTPEGWKYDINREFDVRPMGDSTSPLSKTARWACDNYDSLPDEALPFNFDLS